MTHDEFLKRVQKRTGLSRKEAERQTGAFFEALASRIGPGMKEELAQDLPSPLDQGLLVERQARDVRPGRSFHEYIGQHPERTGEEVSEHSRAIWEELLASLPAQRQDQWRSAIPRDFESVLSG